jgi:hypothetical protein
MIFFGSIILVSLVLGIGSALWLIGRVFSSPIQNGPWIYNPLIGSQAAQGYLRATIAKVGLLALSQAEAIYFIASRDSDGNPLKGGTTYRIEGENFQARWWSITAYAPDSFLIPNSQNRYSYNMDNLLRNQDGSYTIYASSSEQDGNWLPTGQAKTFDLTLRLYNLAPSMIKNIDKIALPRIIKESRVHGR